MSHNGSDTNSDFVTLCYLLPYHVGKKMYFGLECELCMIPVEDFTGLLIGEIKKFLKIIDDTRRN